MRQLIEWNGLIVERRGLQDDGGCADETRHDEDPQEETIEHHSNEFPIFNHLNLPVRVLGVFGDELDAPQSATNIRRK